MDHKQPPSLLKSLAIALATLAFSTWALGTLWQHAESADGAPAVAAAR